MTDDALIAKVHAYAAGAEYACREEDLHAAADRLAAMAQQVLTLNDLTDRLESVQGALYDRIAEQQQLADDMVARAAKAEAERDALRKGYVTDDALREQIERVVTVVNEQAEDAGLWFVAQYASEAHLQEALRRLHAAVEGEKWTAERDYRIAALTAEHEQWMRDHQIEVDNAHRDRRKAEAERDALREALLWMQRKGGLGLDVHERIDAALAGAEG